MKALAGLVALLIIGMLGILLVNAIYGIAEMVFVWFKCRIKGHKWVDGYRYCQRPDCLARRTSVWQWNDE